MEMRCSENKKRKCGATRARDNQILPDALQRCRLIRRSRFHPCQPLDDNILDNQNVSKQLYIAQDNHIPNDYASWYPLAESQTTPYPTAGGGVALYRGYD